MSRRTILQLLAPLLLAPASAFALPDGPGREAVEAVCLDCHDARRIERSMGYSKDDWREHVSGMIDLSGDPDTEEAVTAYLAAHFPPNGRRAATPVPGDLRVRFTAWSTPTLGQRPRDPIEDADGAVWWVGQWGDIVGRLDPATGEMTEYPLPPGAKPHTVTLDAQGGVWYTGNKNATIGKVDPADGTVTEFPMPDPDARDPHSAIFDPQGILWFTLQHSNMIGRLDPRSGEIRLVEAPREGSRPYGIRLDANGAPWVACNGANCLLRVDTETMDLHEVKLPIADTTVRRLDVAPDGRVWYVNSRQGRIGVHDPATGETREWPSPSGPKSHPYALVWLDGAVWYNESGVRPDMLVRFAPETETFQSWPIPSGGIHSGILRHMRTSSDGGLWIHQTATNLILKVDVLDE